MPELPEVEVLVRHLRPLLQNQMIRHVTVRRPKVLLPTASQSFRRVLSGAKFTDLSRRGKFLVFTLRGKSGRPPIQLLGHLGMTGRMYLAQKNVPLPKHAAVVFELGRENFIYEDPPGLTHTTDFVIFVCTLYLQCVHERGCKRIQT